MEKATFVNAFYNESSTITCQGNRSSINKYLKEGYYIKEERNGYWVLVKPVSVRVTLKNSENEISDFNMKQDILDYYNKTKISHKLFTQFSKDASSGKIQFYMDDNGYYFE